MYNIATLVSMSTPITEAAGAVHEWQEKLVVRVAHAHHQGVPVAELARQARVSRSTIYGWLRGDRMPK